ncbi:hypothetical protein [Paractinoplanes toevensis]|uniref:Tox-REase-5 domain-containing protein n=1 Tax=Paractinoplanes toevensis TaxID=571911 RepID=A0A920BRA3_9ACTN|nr:hypothetical protein [Actinoplanes toevensis]GIM97441.1 hypothetical protein Ato02nite_092340 [Actinoplanes toevensis]
MGFTYARRPSAAAPAVQRCRDDGESCGRPGQFADRFARATPAVQRQPAADVTQMSITAEFAQGLSDEELIRQGRAAMGQLAATAQDDPGYPSYYQNLALLLRELQHRPQAGGAAARLSGRPGMLPLFLEWQSAGLLDPPFRPSEVPGFPSFPVTAAQSAQIGPGLPLAGAGLGLGPGLGGGYRPLPPIQFPIEPVPTEPVPIRPPVLEPIPEPVVDPTRIPAVPPIAIFLIVLLWPSETAPAWMDGMNQVTGEPYGSEQEYQWVNRLTPGQRDYLTRLARARREVPDPALETDPAPWEVPRVEARPEEEDSTPGCVGQPIPRRGGHRRHDAYATKVTGTTQDYYARTPYGLEIAYDGQGHGLIDMWEVKVGFGWFFNPDSAGLRDLTLARFDAQMARGMAVAATCGYLHLWTIPDRWVAGTLNARWGGTPPVLSIPE